MSNEHGANSSALQHGMPKSTLKDHISGRVQHGTKHRQVAYLTSRRRKSKV